MPPFVNNLASEPYATEDRKPQSRRFARIFEIKHGADDSCSRYGRRDFFGRRLEQLINKMPNRMIVLRHFLPHPQSLPTALCCLICSTVFGVSRLLHQIGRAASQNRSELLVGTLEPVVV